MHSDDLHSDISGALATEKSMVTISGQQQSNEKKNLAPNQTVVTNDFAAELLYMMRAAGDMLGD